jgi:hypothetical protein
MIKDPKSPFLWKFYIPIAIKSVLRIYRRERFVQLSADMKWTGYSSTKKAREHLVDLICGKKSNFKRVFEAQTSPYSAQVELCVKGGKVASRSCFVFLKYSRKKSKIIGACSTNKLIDLINDFDILKEHITKLNLNFRFSEPKIFLENNEVCNNMIGRRLSMKSVLPDFLGTIGFFSGASSYLIFGELNQITVAMFTLGLISWIGSAIFGSWNRQKFVFIEQE